MGLLVAPGSVADDGDAADAAVGDGSLVDGVNTASEGTSASAGNDDAALLLPSPVAVVRSLDADGDRGEWGCDSPPPLDGGNRLAVDADVDAIPDDGTVAVAGRFKRRMLATLNNVVSFACRSGSDTFSVCMSSYASTANTQPGDG